MSDHVTEPSKIIHLPFENLRCFETVQEQFAHLGILFDNAVVLQPSNAIYFPEVGRMVLMAAPQNGWMDIRFPVPVTHFSCRLTSSQAAIATAYDGEAKILKSIETASLFDPGAVAPPESIPDLDDTDTEHHENAVAPPPNLPIEIHCPHIARITLSSLDGQLVIYDVKFGV